MKIIMSKSFMNTTRQIKEVGLAVLRKECLYRIGNKFLFSNYLLTIDRVEKKSEKSNDVFQRQMEQRIIYRNIRKRQNGSIFQLKFILPERDARIASSLSFAHIRSSFCSCFLRFAFQSIWRCKLELYSCKPGTTEVHIRDRERVILQPRVLH